MSKFRRGNSRSAKLTALQVQEIRLRYAAGLLSQGSLSREFGVSIVQIGRIVRGEVWQHLPPVPLPADKIQESAQRMLALQERVNNPTALEQGIQDRLREQEEELGALSRLTEEIRERRKEERKADTLLNELKGEGNGTAS